MPQFPRRNLKLAPIPVVPRNLQILNPADGTVTRSGQLLLEQLLGSGADAGLAGPCIRTLDLVDLTPGVGIAPFVPVYEPGPGVRAIGVLRKPIEENLVIEISRNDEVEPLFRFTFLASTEVGAIVEQDISNLFFEDLDVLIASITDSDSSTDPNGVATLSIHWTPVTEEGDGSGGTGGGSGGGFVPAGDLMGTDESQIVIGLSAVPLDTSVGLPADGQVITYDAGTGKYTAVSPKAPLIIGFVMNSGGVGVNVGPMLTAPRAGSFSRCVVTVKASDPTFALGFTVRQNGTFIFSVAPFIAAATPSGTVSTFTGFTTVPLPVAAGDTFTIDIASGTLNWQFTAQLET